jgi:crotonobetainyl-CoA:carnitine CoA-transferase CaiB-like acyl-CoA transferase
MLMGPAAVQYLADLGADVIKVETPGRGAWERNWAGADAWAGEVSIFFLMGNRNQRGLTLDLKHPSASEVVRRLLAGADLLVENFRPGVMERLGLGYDQLRDSFPRLIYVSASGYGSSGPYRDRPGQDLLLQAMSGLAAITGSAARPPTATGSAIVDQHAAALIAMAGLAALLHRERTGQGGRVEVSLLRAALDLQSEPLAYHLNGHAFRRPEAELASAFHPAPYGIYQTSDSYLALSLSPLSTLRQVPDFGGIKEFPEDAAYRERDQIRRHLEPIIRTRSTDEWIEELAPHGIWCGPVNDYDHVFDDPQVQHVDPTIELQYPGVGGYSVLGLPITLDGYEPPRRRPPQLGEHTHEILAELGFDAAAIDRLSQEGAI